MRPAYLNEFLPTEAELAQPLLYCAEDGSGTLSYNRITQRTEWLEHAKAEVPRVAPESVETESLETESAAMEGVNTDGVTEGVDTSTLDTGHMAPLSNIMQEAMAAKPTNHDSNIAHQPAHGDQPSQNERHSS
jgi:hypothetical protein